MELVALDELTVTEAASALGVRAVTARVRLHRGERLAVLWHEHMFAYVSEAGTRSLSLSGG